jgi:glutamyl-tRNA synthetase
MTQLSPRVRFAPSPTGYLHVGGLRTALYNYLFARRLGGQVILRIEDTDRSRFVDGAMESLIETLAWAGLHFDEGPGLEGDCGPYIQSQRSELYSLHAQKLLDDGNAYRCFCTAETLEASRRKLSAEKKDQAYDRRCRVLSATDVQQRMDEGLPFTIRLKVPTVGQMEFRDLIRDDVAVHFDAIDDQVLVKSDGFPTYHLANVVDDHHMRITHVIRGEEWLPSTPKHLLLYQYFGWDAPAFAHLPLLLNEDRTKLSKRQGDVAVEDFRNKGFLPAALLNFVALLGWNPGDDREIFSLQELAEAFSLERVSKSGAVFDIEKLKWFNAQYLRALPTPTLAAECGPWMRAAGFDTSDPVRTETVAAAFAKYLTLPSDIGEHLRFLTLAQVTLQNSEDRDLLASHDSQRVLIRFADLAETQEPWERDAIKAMIQQVQSDTGIKGKGLFMPLRLALSAEQHGPDLGLMAELLGRDACIRRARIHLL